MVRPELLEILACPKCKSKKVTQLLAPFYAKTVRKS